MIRIIESLPRSPDAIPHQRVVDVLEIDNVPFRSEGYPVFMLIPKAFVLMH